MATPLTADALVDALLAEGVRVAEHDGWHINNRNHVGAWGPVNGVMIHHTVTSSTAATVSLCYNGRSGLPGPLCHGVIAKDGTVHLVGHGRANHAGSGDADVHAAVRDESYGSAPPAPNSDSVDGNTHYYGWECINLGDGVDPWPEAQVDAIARASAAVCRAHGWSAKSVIGHKEWTSRKIDPRGFTMPSLRDLITQRLAHPASWNPEDELVTTPTENASAVWGYQLATPSGDTMSAGAQLRTLWIKSDRVQTTVDGIATSLTELVETSSDPQPVTLTDEQIQTLAVHPALAEAIAERVATKLAERLSS